LLLTEISVPAIKVRAALFVPDDLVTLPPIVSEPPSRYRLLSVLSHVKAPVLSTPVPFVSPTTVGALTMFMSDGDTCSVPAPPLKPMLVLVV
jgi:hypothetical protein